MLAPVLAVALAASQPSRVDVRVDSTEASAVLDLLARRAEGGAPTDAELASLYATDAYARLKQRETEIKRPFTDDEFRAFVTSDALLEQRAALQRCLAAWQQADLQAAAERARRYLPADARLRATVYLVVKPKPNSFVFELATNPAIFFAVGADAPEPAVIQNTVAHELHHVGAASVADGLASLPEPRRTAALWTGAFSEGIAMLAAAGGPDVHPHAVSPPAERARWDADLARASEDLGAVSAFLLAAAEGRLAGAAITAAGHRFHGESDRPQGAWYTLGWRMAVLVERHRGRAAVVASLRDPRLLLERYQEVARELNAAGDRLPLWPDRLLRLLSDPS